MPESRLLQSLPDEVLASISVDLERLDLERGEYLLRVGEKVEYVYFPTSCLISMITTLENGSSVEAVTIGNDGFAGMAAFLGIDGSDLTGMVQIPGETLRMRVDAFRTHLQNPYFRTSLGAFTARVISTMGQSTACIAFHPVHERLARWLLLVSDSTESEEFRLTQDFLAMMLGVHRPTVTIAIRLLESAGIIKHRRGLISIVDRDTLMEASCECYRLSGLNRRHS